MRRGGTGPPREPLPPGERADAGTDVIDLNGTSSSGKSSLARSLLEPLDEPAVTLGVDAVLVALAPYLVGEALAEWPGNASFPPHRADGPDQPTADAARSLHHATFDELLAGHPPEEQDAPPTSSGGRRRRIATGTQYRHLVACSDEGISLALQELAVLQAMRCGVLAETGCWRARARR